MWRTPEGERTLRGAEWDLFREGLNVSWDWVEEAMDDPELYPFGVDAFDALQPNQRLALLALVGSALTDESLSYPELTAHTEGAVAAVFSNLMTQIALEVDYGLDAGWEDPMATRRLALAAWREAVEQDEANDRKAGSGDKQARPVPTLPATDGAAVEDDDEWHAPAEDCDDLAEWESLLDCLACRILWDDDFNMAEYFMDGDPRESRRLMGLMGIAEDYFTSIAPDPTDKELTAIRKQLRKLTGRKQSRKRRR